MRESNFEDIVLQIANSARQFKKGHVLGKRPDERLSNSGRKYRRLYDSMMDGVAFVDMQGHIRHSNNAYRNMLGYSDEELSRLTYIDLTPQEWLLFEQKIIEKQVLSKGYSDVYEKEYRKKDGTVFPVELRVFLVQSESGENEGMWAIVRDITERKRAEEALRNSQHQLAEAQRIAHIGSFEYDLAMDKLFLSDEAFRILGLSLPEDSAIFKTLPDRFLHEDSSHLTKIMADILSTEGYRELATRILLPDGAGKVVQIRIQTIYDDGRRSRYIGTIQDITKIKRVEDTLKQNEAYIKTVMDNLPLGIAVNSVAPEIVFEYMNDNFCTLYRTDRTLLNDPGHFWTTVYEDPVFRETIKKRVLDDCASGDVARMHWENIPITRKGEETTYVSAINVPIPGRSRMISIVWDVTAHVHADLEREKLQAQLTQAQKMESIGRLAGGVAHDFNNMLSAIIGHSELAMMRVDPKQSIYQDLAEILKAAERSANLTRQLLAFARRQVIIPQVLDLNETIEAMLKMLSRLIGENIELVWRPWTELWPIKVDPGQIDQIMANLCVNAADAIAGTGKIVIETQNIIFDAGYCSHHPEAVPGSYVAIMVSDTGCGIARDILGKLFEPFFTTKEEGKGTGLGLATVYGIVKQNSGYIYVYSEPGQGSSFKIYLPRHFSQGEQASPEDATDVRDGCGSETVLLVEDEPAMLNMTQQMLQFSGYHVLVARKPGEALKLAETYPDRIHILISDVVMPDMNGRELAGRLTALKPGLKVLYMSGYTADIITHNGVLISGANFLQKPFTVKVLREKLRSILDDNPKSPSG